MPRPTKKTGQSDLATINEELERKDLDALTLEQLRGEAKRYGLQVSGDRDALIETIMTHLERHSPISEAVALDGETAQQRNEEPPQQGNQAGSSDNLAQVLALTAVVFIVAAIVTRREWKRNSVISPGRESIERQSANSQQPSSSESRSSLIATVSPAHVVTLLAPQIPEFGGLKEDNVRQWVQRVTKVAQVYRATDEIILLAASSRLIKAARRWFDVGTGSMLESWTEFREAIVKRFDC